MRNNKKTVIITGAGGLVGSEACQFYLNKNYNVVGIDNDFRSHFFGIDASTKWQLLNLQKNANFEWQDTDIRNKDDILAIFKKHSARLEGVIHCAAQPSHDWASKDPHLDFSINALGTLNLLEALKLISTNVPFVFLSTNKVYGDTPNFLPLEEQEARWELPVSHKYGEHGIDETMSIDQSTHSLFGASKASADLLVQEYGRYFDMPTACFRGGCLTGGAHSGAELHGFLSYLVKATYTGLPYKIYGYKGKQVRDNIHSSDLIKAIDLFISAPQSGKVYNIGGGRASNCSMNEAIMVCQEVTNRELTWTYESKNRVGDHIWWISDTRSFKNDYPSFNLSYSINDIIEEIYHTGKGRW